MYLQIFFHLTKWQRICNYIHHTAWKIRNGNAANKCLENTFTLFAIKITDLLIGLLPRKRHALLVAHIIIISSHLKTWTTPASVRRLRPRQYFRRSVPTLFHATTAAVKNRTASKKSRKKVRFLLLPLFYLIFYFNFFFSFQSSFAKTWSFPSDGFCV